jgi:hypothetical protein
MKYLMIRMEITMLLLNSYFKSMSGVFLFPFPILYSPFAIQYSGMDIF